MQRLSGIIMALFIICTGQVHAWDTDDITIHGFASAGYMCSDHYNFLTSSKGGSFEFNEVGINFSTDIRDNMRIGLQLYSFDLGDIGNNEIKLDWAFLDYEWKEKLGLRVGKIKTPLGLYNEMQDYDMLHTAILFPQSIYSKNMRETLISFQGLDIYGKISLGVMGKLDYDFYLGGSEIATDGGMAKLNERDGVIFKSSKIDYLTGNKITWHTPLKGLNFCGSFTHYQAENNMEYNLPLSSFNPSLPDQLTALVPMRVSLNKAFLYIVSVEYEYQNLSLAGEYCWQNQHLKSYLDLSPFGGISRIPFLNMKPDFKSCYALISYRFNDWFEAGTYYAIFLNDEDFQTTDLLKTQRDLAVSTRFDINESWLIKLEVHFMGGAGLVVEKDNPDLDYNSEPNWILYAIKTTFNF